MSDFPSKAEFEAAVGSEFTMELDDGALAPMLLRKCETRTDTPLQECFSLIFVAPGDTPPVQMMRPLKAVWQGSTVTVNEQEARNCAASVTV